jgi:hypothetical protein
MRRSARTWRSRGNLGLILASHRAVGAPFCWSRCRGDHDCDGSLILTAAGAAVAPFLYWGIDSQTRSTCIDHEDKRCEGKTLDGMRKKKMMRRRKILIKELGFFTLAKCALLTSTS